MDNINTIITRIEGAVYAYKPEAVMSNISLLTQKTSELTLCLEADQVALLNQILVYMVTAIENKDYLLLSDILHYELEPFLDNIKQTTGEFTKDERI